MSLKSFILSGLLVSIATASLDLSSLRDQVKAIFYHAYNGYLDHAFPYDELRPLSCDGIDTWGSYSLTLVDALDTLAVLGNQSEFQRVSEILIDRLDFNVDLNVSVFETNIRVVGGLLSAHLMAQKVGVDVDEKWPCDGPLLKLAVDLARRLLPAFNTRTGMPYGTVNLKRGVDPNETPITCTAGVGTFIVEFATISRLTGDQVFEKVALRALKALHSRRSKIGLVGNHIDVQSGRWTALDSGVGAAVDSYFEYLVKGAILLDKPELMEMFKEYISPIEKHIKHGDWYMWVNMDSGSVTQAMHQSLDAFWPGLQTLYGDADSAYKTLLNYYSVWRKYGATPEFYSIPHAAPYTNREGYPLRPELIESTMYMYRVNKDPMLLEFGNSAMHSINVTSRTECGFASIKDVQDHTLDNRMESFFLAETIKYLYLLFDPGNPLLSTMKGATIRRFKNGEECLLGAGGFVFNTEAHPMDVSSLHCCDTMRKEMQKSEIYKILQDYDPEDIFQVSNLTRDLNPGPFTKTSRNNNQHKEGFNISAQPMSCSRQPFHMRLSKYGQIFTDD
ncbi:unnamed protein product [Clavelina lepadiformis]|uniref:alpha-1,2-Mannosidase n=1 Tax=Clavelina lepadiformis TaxID=159417 RepID=A0ABP0GQ14_CLALP